MNFKTILLKIFKKIVVYGIDERVTSFTIKSKDNMMIYSIDDFQKDCGLNGFRNEVNSFQNINYALPCSPKKHVKRIRTSDTEWKTRVHNASMYNLCELKCTHLIASMEINKYSRHLVAQRSSEVNLTQ